MKEYYNNLRKEGWLDDDDDDDDNNNNNNYMSNGNFLVDLEDSKLKEPKKTFIEEGIMNRDGSVTNKGLEIVTAFILNKYGAEIKKDMVDVVVKNRKNKVKEYDIKF